MAKQERTSGSWHRLVGCVTLGSLLLSFTGPRKVEADAPILTGFAVGVAAGLVANWIYDGVTEDDDRVCVTTTTCVDDGGSSGGSPIVGKARLLEKKQTCVTTTVYTQSAPTTVLVPDDFGGLPDSPGHDISEGINFAAGEGGAEVSFENINYQADVTKTPAPTVNFETVREMSFRYVRSPGAPLEDDTFTVPVNISDLILSTTDLEGTTAQVEFDLAIEVSGHGTVFQTNVGVKQGELPVISGDIPASEFFTDVGVAALNFDDEIEFEVPADQQSLDFAVTLRTSGIGVEQNALEIPAVGPVGAATFAAFLSICALWFVRRMV